MRNQGMVSDMDFHNPYLTALSFLSNEWEYGQHEREPGRPAVD
jgi:hypothetical protein